MFNNCKKFFKTKEEGKRKEMKRKLCGSTYLCKITN